MQDHPDKFKNFIFDLDGTLLDTVPDLVLLTNRILEEVGCPTRTQEEILSFVGSGVRRLIYLALPENSSEELQDKAMALWNKLFYDYYDHTFPYEGIPEVIDKLKEAGCKLGVVSNKLQSGVDLIMVKTLPIVFDVMLGDSPIVPRKPDPTGLNMAMGVMGVAPIDTIYIGDSPGDMLAAHNAGLAAACALWGYHKLEDFKEGTDEYPDVFLEKPLDILTLLNG